MRIAEMERQNRKNVIKYLESEGDQEKKPVLDFLRDHKLRVFSYPFSLKYNAKDIKVFSREDRRKYVIYDGKKLFFKKAWGKQEIQSYFNNLRLEQDENSPHNYFNKPEYLPSHGDAIADVGTAEGIWALAFIERCARAYLFESDLEWIEALETTFAPWGDKVEIVNKFVGAADGGEDFISLDSFFRDKTLDCVKADIEGSEEDMLRGGGATFTGRVSKAVICSYHRRGDEGMIKSHLAACGFDAIETSGGYMIFEEHEEELLTPPYLSRGLVFSRKREK